MNVSTNIDVMTSLDSVTLSTPASRSAEEPLTPHGQGQPIELMDSKYSVYSASSTKPGVVKTTRQMKKTETMKFFTSQLSKKHRTRRKCMQCSYARKGFAWYQKAFRYVVLFKWLRWSLRKKLNIPKLITFWMSIVIGVAWIYNGVLFSQSEQMHRGDDSCIQQCSIILGSSCIDEYEDLNDRRKATAKFFIINSFYITFCAIFSIHLVLEITGSLRNLGKALKNVMKKKNSSDIVRKMTYSVDNATAETNSVLEPIRAMISHQHNLKKRAENAEAKWSEAVRKNEMLEALLDIDRDTRNMNLQQTLLQKQAELTIFVSTWNVGNNVPQGNLSSWLGEAQLCDIVAIGVQECTYHVKSKSEKGFTLHATGKKILKSVAPTFGCANNFEKLIQRHLGDQFYLEERVHISGNDSTLQDVAGIRLFIFVKKRHAPWVRSVSRHCVKRGIKVTLNKGAVACSIIAYGTRIAFINSHFHAHQDKVEERNSDYKEIARKLFTKKCSLDGKHPFNILTRDHLTPREPGCCHHVVFWMGDLNYRIELPHENVVDYIAKCQNGTEEWRNLFAFDQLNTQRQLGKAFYGYKEFPIDFMPTYKLNDDRTGYDLGRTPSWCDRIFVKSIDGINLYQLTYDADCMIATSDHHPVTASYKLQAPLPIFDSSDLFSSAFIHLRKIQVTFFRENDIGSALSKHYASLVQRCDQEGYSISPEESDTVILAYEGEENPEDISLIASYITLTCCGTMIERIVSVDWVNKTLSLGLHMNVAQTLSQFPEPISLGIWVCKPKQITPRPSQKSVRIGYEDNMTAAEDVPPSPSPSWHGAHDNLENLIMDNYDLVGEAVIETKDLFSVYLSQNRNISNFNTTLLYGGVKVGSVAGQMNISSEGSQDFHDISISSTDN